MTRKTNSDKSPTAAISYIPHITFIIAQIYCGIFVVFLLAPPLYAIISSCECGRGLDTNFRDLFYTFPAWWSKLSALSAGEMSLIIFCCFPIGFIFAEAFYRFATLIRYIKEINLENLNETITEASEIKHFKTRCYIQRDISLQRVWDWENFQSSFCLYLEGTLVVFCFLFFVSICYTGYFLGESLEIFWMVTCLAILFLSVFLTLLMRRARIEKFKALHHAHKAIKKILDEEKN